MGAVAGLCLVVAGGALATGLVRLGGPRAGPAPGFVDETAAAGLDFTYDGGFRHSAGGGLAAFDCDGDGRPELYLAGGDGPAALFHNDSPAGGGLRLTRRSDAATDLANVNGAYPIDLDGDGVVDLMTLRDGENVALRGLGDCRFERANEAWGLDGGEAQTMGFSATWERGNDRPTLAFGTYVDPDNFDLDARCGPNALFRPVAPAPGAAPAYGPAVELTPSFCTLSLLFSDWSGTGRADLRVTNDRAFYRQAVGQEQLWRIQPGEPPRLYGESDGWARVQVEGMGIASHDLTGDGRPEVYLTSQAASRLQTLVEGAAGPAYVDIGLERGASASHPFTGPDTHLPSTAWHPQFADVNNDGLMDLFVSKGNVTAQPDFAVEDPSNLLLGQPDGTFVEAANRAGIVVPGRGRGAALVDLNLDGRLDLVESFYGAPVRAWRNVGPVDSGDAREAHWVALRLRQSGGNAGAIGAVVEIRSGEWRQAREVVIGGGHASGQLGWLHVGLGGVTTPEVRVRWPDGELGPWLPILVDRLSIVDREAGTVTPWGPAAQGLGTTRPSG
jgi:hypothetical protein